MKDLKKKTFDALSISAAERAMKKQRKLLKTKKKTTNKQNL